MLIYLVRLAEVCHIDLPSAVVRKIELNREKFPIDEHKSKMDDEKQN